jgi:hypothetical protein
LLDPPQSSASENPREATDGIGLERLTVSPKGTGCLGTRGDHEAPWAGARWTPDARAMQLAIPPWMGATCRPCGLTCEGTTATTRAGSPFLAHRACHAPGWSERPDLPSKSSTTRCGGVGGTRGVRREGGKRVILRGTPFLLLGTIMPNMIWVDEQDTSNFYMCHFCRVSDANRSM